MSHVNLKKQSQSANQNTGGHTPPPARLGFLYPGHAAEDDYPLMGSMVTTTRRLNR
jgi:hypothetical protein